MSSAPFETLSDDDLHVAVRRLTALSNVTLADLLAHLGEVEARGIHRNRACASLYTYCIYELRMSEDAAFRRAKAARLVHEHPELRDILARGELHLTGLLMIAPYLGGDRHAEVLQRARFRSKREIARLIVEIDPKPEVPPSVEPVAPAGNYRAAAKAFAEALAGPVRNLPTGDRPADWIDGGYDQGTDTESAQDRASRDLAGAECALESAWRDQGDAHLERPLRYKVQFTADQEYVDLLEEAFDLLRIGRKAASLPEVQLRALRELVERLRKRRRGAPATSAAPTTPAQTSEMTTSAAPARVSETSASAAPVRVSEMTTGAGPATPARVTVTARAAEPAPLQDPLPNRNRYIPVAVRRTVWARDGARCAYVDVRGHRCPERRGLEVHHREAHAFGGPVTVENLELRCRPHNVLAAEQDFGREHMDRYGTQPGNAALV